MPASDKTIPANGSQIPSRGLGSTENPSTSSLVATHLPLRACLSKQFQWVARIGGLEEHTGLVPTSIGQAPNGRLPAQDLHRGQDGYYGSVRGAKVRARRCSIRSQSERWARNSAIFWHPTAERYEAEPNPSGLLPLLPR